MNCRMVGKHRHSAHNPTGAASRRAVSGVRLRFSRSPSTFRRIAVFRSLIHVAAVMLELQKELYGASQSTCSTLIDTYTSLYRALTPVGAFLSRRPALRSAMLA
jgi:hypothetical protein